LILLFQAQSENIQKRYEKIQSAEGSFGYWSVRIAPVFFEFSLLVALCSQLSDSSETF
jgi:hypothetical protein